MPPLSSVSWTDEEVQGADAVLLITNHAGVDYDKLKQARLVVDTRGLRELLPDRVKA